MLVGRSVTLVASLVFAVACGNATLPLSPSSVPASSTPAPTVITGTTYLFSTPLSSRAVSHLSAASKFVLDDHGAFTLQYSSLPKDYPGSYRQDNGVLTFRFSGDTRWEATGTMHGDSLEVRYNLEMGLADFEDAVYARSQ
jgi:hypothetical protein